MKAKFYLEIEQDNIEFGGNLTTSENVEKHLQSLLTLINTKGLIIKSAQYEYTVKSEVFN